MFRHLMRGLVLGGASKAAAPAASAALGGAGGRSMATTLGRTLGIRPTGHAAGGMLRIKHAVLHSSGRQALEVAVRSMTSFSGSSFGPMEQGMRSSAAQAPMQVPVPAPWERAPPAAGQAMGGLSHMGSAQLATAGAAGAVQGSALASSPASLAPHSPSMFSISASASSSGSQSAASTTSGTASTSAGAGEGSAQQQAAPALAPSAPARVAGQAAARIYSSQVRVQGSVFWHAQLGSKVWCFVGGHWRAFEGLHPRNGGCPWIFIGCKGAWAA